MEERVIMEGVADPVSKKGYFIQKGHGIITNKRFIYCKQNVVKTMLSNPLDNLANGHYEYDIPLNEIQDITVEDFRLRQHILVITKKDGKIYKYGILDWMKWAKACEDITNSLMQQPHSSTQSADANTITVPCKCGVQTKFEIPNGIDTIVTCPNCGNKIFVSGSAGASNPAPAAASAVSSPIKESIKEQNPSVSYPPPVSENNKKEYVNRTAPTSGGPSQQVHQQTRQNTGAYTSTSSTGTTTQNSQRVYQAQPYQSSVKQVTAQAVIKRIRALEITSSVLWIVIGALQIVMFYTALVGIWNIVNSIICLCNLRNIVVGNPMVVPYIKKRYVWLIVTTVVNLVLGGVIGVFIAALDWYIYYYTIKNEQILTPGI